MSQCWDADRACEADRRRGIHLAWRREEMNRDDQIVRVINPKRRVTSKFEASAFRI